MNEIKRLQQLAGITEIRVNKPISVPISNTQEELLKYLIDFPRLKEEIIKKWFDLNPHTNDDESWNEVKQRWINSIPEFDFDMSDIILDDGNDNILYIRLTPFHKNLHLPKHEININGKTFYLAYY
jgi:hypothetical protein